MGRGGTWKSEEELLSSEPTFFFLSCSCWAPDMAYRFPGNKNRILSVRVWGALVGFGMGMWVQVGKGGWGPVCVGGGAVCLCVLAYVRGGGGGDDGGP